jgi:hypothetical protein
MKKDHLDKIKYNIGYTINETPKYRPILDNTEFDEIPELKEVENNNPEIEQGDGNPETGQEGGNPEINPEMGQGDGNPETNPETGLGDGNPETGQSDGNPEMGGVGDEISQSEENVDMLQNDIIRHNIEAMKSIHGKLENLDSYVKNINDQLTGLSAKVKEVEEPTDGEKLASKKNVSYPFYLNLNDYWKNNWFDQQREISNEKGIRKLPDGTFIADFDDISDYSDLDFSGAFNNIV